MKYTTTAAAPAISAVRVGENFRLRTNAMNPLDSDEPLRRSTGEHSLRCSSRSKTPTVKLVSGDDSSRPCTRSQPGAEPSIESYSSRIRYSELNKFPTGASGVSIGTYW